MREPDMKYGTCRSCGAPVLWAETDRGGLILLDAEPVPDGNVVVEGGVARVLAGSLFEAPPAGPRHRPHFQTCPGAPQHRGRR